MDGIRIAGVVVAILFAAFGLYKYRQGKWRKIDLLLDLIISLGIGVVAVVPQIGNVLTDMFNLRNRGIAILVLSNLVLFALFLYLLNQVRISNRRSGEIIRAIARERYKHSYSSLHEGGSVRISAKHDGNIMIIIPAYNEADAIRGVLARTPKELLGYRVDTVVVVDGATDGTEAVVAQHDLPVATHIVNRGQGDALRTGFEIAQMEGADIVVNMDADGQHRPEELEKLISPIIKDEADFVMGSRFKGHYDDAGGARHTGIVIFSRLITLLAGVKITDCTNGFRAIRGSDLQKLDLREDRFNSAELILQAAKHGLRIREVPISIMTRTSGESKKPKRLGYPLGFLRVIILTWMR